MQLCQVIEVKPGSISSKGKSYNGVNLKLNIDGVAKRMFIFNDDPLFKQISSLVSGSTIEVDIEENDKGYMVLKGLGEIKEPSKDSKPVQQTKAPYQKFTPEERTSIERQTSIKAAVELIAASGVKFKTVDDAYQEVIHAAEGFYDYITGKVQTSSDSE